MVFRKNILLILLAIACKSGFAQENGNNTPARHYCIEGIAFDSNTNSAISKASIESITESVSDNSRTILHTVSDTTGFFRVCSVNPVRKLKISFPGYADREIAIRNDADTLITLKRINLKAKVATLQGVSARAKKEPEIITIDKKTYSVSQNILATGGTAIDALKQIPAVNVDNEGNISLRGSNNITIYINGKQSSLSGADRQALLMQIPAANIESIEVNTNPSAKVDAEGQSGIINITLKQNTAKYKNGYVTLGAGTNDKYNGTASFNTTYKKFAFGNTLSFRKNNVWGRGYNLRDNHTSALTNTIDQYNDNDNLTYNYALSGNIDYNANKTLLISANYLLSQNRYQLDELNRIELYDMNDSLYQIITRQTDQASSTKNIDAGLTFRKSFDKPSNFLLVMFNYSATGVKSNSEFTQNELNTLNEDIKTPNPYLLYNRNTNRFSMPLFQLDYTRTLIQNIKLETGMKYTGRNIDNDFLVDSFNHQQQVNQVDKSKSNHFLYNENVSAAYAMITHPLNKIIKYNLGLRFENTAVAGDQLASGEKFGYSYHNLFPSGNINFNLQKAYHIPDLQLSYSKRINRPGQHELNPFVSFNDPYNLSKGNPNLKPEISHAMEFSALYSTKAVVYTATFYGRQTNLPISRYNTIDTNGVATTTRVNLGYNRSIGGELIVRFSPLKDLKVILNGNLYKYVVAGNVVGNSFVNERISYSGKANLNYQFWKKTDIQASFNYMGPIVTPQGSLKAMYGLEIGVKKDIIKDKLSFSINLADVFNNRRFAITLDDPSFNSSIYRKRETRILTLNLTWKFGATDNKQSERKPKQPERTPDMDF